MTDYVSWTVDLNQRGRSNENFVCELPELYTLGKGDTIAPGDYARYTEDDIKAAARPNGLACRPNAPGV